MTISLTRVVLLLVLTGLLAWAAFDYQGDQLSAVRTALTTKETQLATAQGELDSARAAARQLAGKLEARDQVDQQRTEELNRAYQDNQDLQRAVADGRRRLLVQATCSRPAVPTATGAAGVADAGTAELAADARSDYFTLRDELALAREMILGLQDYIRQVVFDTPAQP